MKKITIIFMSVLMIFASCSTDIPYEDNINENTKTVEEPKEDDAENDNDEEGNSENTEIVEEPKEDDAENKTWCEIGEDTNILGLNYFVCINNSQTKLNPSTNDESQIKKDTFLIRGYASRYVEIRVEYNNKKLNFSSVSDSYIITDVMKKDSTINITIEWK